MIELLGWTIRKKNKRSVTTRIWTREP